jgi:TP901 family phage tail tape measure protein
MGNRLASLGSRITFGVSAPLAGALGAIGKFGADFDKAMTESTSIMSNMNDALRKQREETAFTVARSTKFGATEAAEAYYDLASAGLSAEDSMGSLQTVANFAQAGVMKLSDAGDYLAGAVTAVGDASLGTTGKVEGMAKMADILTAANNSALGTVEDFAKAISTRAGGAINQYGLSIEQGVSALMAFASQNIKGQRAGEQMYIALRDMQKASVKNAETWKKEGIEVYNLEGNLRSMGEVINDIARYTEGMSAQQKFAAISLLGFQDKSRGAIQALLGMGPEMQRFEGILGDVAGTAERVAKKQMEAFSNQLKQVTESAKILGIQLFQDFLPILKNDLLPTLKTGVGVLSEVFKMFAQLPGPVKSTALGMAAFLAVLGPAVYVMGGMLSALSALGAGVAVPLRAISTFGTAVHLATNYLTVGHAATVVYGRAMGTVAGTVVNAASAAASGVAAWNNWSKAASAGMMATTVASATTSSSILGLRGAMYSFADTGKMIAQNTVPVMVTGTGKMAAAWTGMLNVGRTLASFLPRLAGPWGMLATAIVTTGIALYKWKTDNTAAVAEMGKNSASLEKMETKLAEVIRVYDDLSKKVNLTKEEKNNLRRATEELAKWTGYSAEGFQNETARSNELLDSLKLQAAQRWNNIQAAKEQLAFNVQDMRIEKEKAALAAETLRRRAKAIGDGTEIIAGVSGRRATKEDRESAIAREIEKANALEERIKQINQTMADLGWGVKNRDIQLGKSTPVPGAPAGEPTGKPPETGPPTTPKADDRAAREPYERTRKSLMTAFLLDLYDMSEAVNEAVSQNTPMPLVLEAWGSEIDKLRVTGRAWGIEMIGNLKSVADASEALNNKNAFAMFDPASGQMTLDTSDLAYMNKLQQDTRDEYEALAQVARASNLAIQDSESSRVAATIQGIENERKAKIEGLKQTKAENAGAYAEAVTAINAEAQFRIDVVNRTADTIVFRMREAGILTNEAMKEAADGAETDFTQMADSGKFSAESIGKAWKKMYDAQIAMSGKFLGAWRAPLATLTQQFQQIAQTVGAGADSWVSFIAGIAGAGQAALTAGDMFSEGFAQFDKGWDMMKKKVAGGGQMMMDGMMGLASGMLAGVGALAQATSGDSLMKNMLGGASTGAMYGGAIGAGIAASMGKGMMVAGVWGAVAGAIVGIMVAYWRGRETRSIMEDVGQEWGGDISKGLADKIKKSKKQFGDQVAAGLYNMSDIVGEVGGWDANLDKIGKLRDVFVMLERGIFDAADAAKVLKDNFANIVTAVETTGRIAPPVIAEIIALNESMGVRSADVYKVLAEQTTKYSTALTGVFGGLSKQYGTLKTDMEAARKAVEDAQTALKDDDSDANRKAAQEANKALAELMAKQAQGAATAGDELARMGRLALAGFVAAEQGGMGTIAALDAMGPALDSLISMYQGLGLSMEGTAVAGLAEFRDRVNQNRELVDSASALNTMMMAASITGALNAESLADMETQGMQTYDSLIAAGFTENETLRLMQGYLQNVYEAHHQMGIPIDEATAKLIAQGIATGVIKDEQLSLNNILMSGLAALITALGGEVPAAWKGFVDKAKGGINEITNKTGELPDTIANQFRNMPTLKIPYEFEQQGDGPELPASERPDPTLNVPHLATGGIVYKPTLAMIGEREAEVVRPLRDDMHRSGSTQPNVDVWLDGRKIGGSSMRHGARYLRDRGVVRR